MMGQNFGHLGAIDGLFYPQNDRSSSIIELQHEAPVGLHLLSPCPKRIKNLHQVLDFRNN